MDHPTNVLLAVSGSVATIKLLPLIKLLQTQSNDKVSIKVVTTVNAQHFFDREDVGKHVEGVYTDAEEWSTWEQEKLVLHIELRRWADIMVIAPLSANTLAKMAGGLCDNLLTSVVRCWDQSKPILVAPAMNTHMWEHPFTSQHLKVLCAFDNITILDPIEKKLVCGDIGKGAMASIETIASEVTQALEKRRPVNGKETE